MLTFSELNSRNGTSFHGYAWSVAVAAQYSSAALTCAAGKQLIIDRLFLSGPGAGCNFSIGIQNTALSGYTAGSYGSNKNSGGAVSASQFYTKQNASAPSASYTASLYYLPAGLVGTMASREIILDAPVILNVGHSLVGYTDGLNVPFIMGVDFKELG